MESKKAKKHLPFRWISKCSDPNFMVNGTFCNENFTTVESLKVSQNAYCRVIISNFAFLVAVDHSRGIHKKRLTQRLRLSSTTVL